MNFSNEIKLELKVPGFNIPDNVRLVNGNLTLDELEQKGTYGDYVLDRGMSIKNLEKTLKELAGKDSYISFNLIKKSDKLLKDLEESEINFINIAGASCYQSCVLQGFVHIIFPLAIKNLNKERIKIGKEPVKALDELKNYNEFNNTVIDVLKEIVYIYGCGHGGKSKNGTKGYMAKKLFEIAPPIIYGGGHEDDGNAVDMNDNTKNITHCSKDFNEAKNAMEGLFNNFGGKKISNPPRKSGIEYKFMTGEDLIKVIEINKKTIVSEVVKFKIEGQNKYHGNLVLKFSQENLNDPNLDIYKLINDCPQIKQNYYKKNRIVETSDIIYIITDRLDFSPAIKKQFNIDDYIYLDNNGYFNRSIKKYCPYTIFELKFIIFHRFYFEDFGHYIAFAKIKGKWYEFDDTSDDYAKNKEPPLINNKDKDYYPVYFYYVKNK